MMCLIKIDTSKQLADIFNKPLAYAQFIGSVRGILGDPEAMRDSGGGVSANSLLRTR